MDDQLLSQWKKEEQASFFGWDFSHIKGRIEHEDPPWNYNELVLDLLKSAQTVLDMGTGGGERLASLQPLPKNTVAVEAYKPNVAVAKKNLEPLGIKVIGVEDMQKLPLPDESFDLILNHHTEYLASDVARLLKPGGTFITQQVGGQNLHDLTEYFDQQVPWPTHNLDNAKQEAEKAGLNIGRAEEWHGKMNVKDIGALVYFMKAIPWIVEGFSVEKHQPYLEKLHQELEVKGEIKFNEHRFLLVLTKNE